MKTKTCGECQYFDTCNVEPGNDICKDFEPISLPQTNGEKLWNSGYDSVIAFSKTWMEKFSCWAEAEDWLNAPADKEVKIEC